MAIEIEVTGSGAFHGAKSNLTEYSVQEQITPIDGSAPAAGVGTISFGAVESLDSRFLMDNEIELRDGARGVASGTIRQVGSGDFALNVTADSILSVLMATRTVGPFEGTLEAAITYYLSLVGVSSGFQVDPSIASRTVILGGWSDVVLSKLSELCTAQQVEMSVVYDQIVFRPLRVNEAVTKRQTSASWSIERGNPALSVDVYYYNYTPLTGHGTVYPSPLEQDRGGYQVDAGQTLEPIRVQTSAFMTSVDQPTPIDFLPPTDFIPPAGVDDFYTILGSDDLPIPAAEWVANDGGLRVEIDPDDSSVLVLNIKGMEVTDDPRAPYRVGVMSSGASTYYNALFISAQGIRFDKQLITFSTGASNTQQVTGATIDNPFVSTPAQAATIATRAVQRFSGLNYTISGEAVSVNRQGAGNEFATSTFQAFDDKFAGQTFADGLDAEGWLFADFDQYFADLVTDQFENQLFGNAAGARVRDLDAFFRITEATTTPGAVSYSAEMDTIVGDWDDVWSGKVFADWDAAMDGHTLRDWGIRPLMEE